MFQNNTILEWSRKRKFWIGSEWTNFLRIANVDFLIGPELESAGIVQMEKSLKWSRM